MDDDINVHLGGISSASGAFLCNLETPQRRPIAGYAPCTCKCRDRALEAGEFACTLPHRPSSDDNGDCKACGVQNREVLPPLQYTLHQDPFSPLVDVLVSLSSDSRFGSRGAKWSSCPDETIEGTVSVSKGAEGHDVTDSGGYLRRPGRLGARGALEEARGPQTPRGPCFARGQHESLCFSMKTSWTR